LIIEHTHPVPFFDGFKKENHFNGDHTGGPLSPNIRFGSSPIRNIGTLQSGHRMTNDFIEG